MLKAVDNKKAIFFAIRISVLILGQVSSILIVRVSTVETYAQYVLINSFVMALCLINQTGLSRLILRELPKVSNQKIKILNFIKFSIFQSSFVSLLLCIFIFLFKDNIVHVLIKNAELKTLNSGALLASIILWFFSLGLLNIITESFRGLDDLGLSMALGGIEGIGGYGKGWIMNISFIFLSISCFAIGNRISTQELTFYSAVFNLFILLVGLIYLFRKFFNSSSVLNFKIKFMTIKLEGTRIVRYFSQYSSIMFYLLFSEVLLLLNSQSDLWLLNQFSDQLNVGYYSVSQRTIGIIIAPIASICSLFIADVSRCFLSEDSTSAFAVINRKISFFSTPSIVLLLILLFFSKQIIVAIYGGQYQEASLILCILSFKGLFVVAFPALLPSLLIVANQREILMISVLGTLASLVFEYVLLMQFSAVGLALGSVLGYGIETLSAYFLLRRKYFINTAISVR